MYLNSVPARSLAAEGILIHFSSKLWHLANFQLLMILVAFITDPHMKVILYVCISCLYTVHEKMSQWLSVSHYLLSAAQ